jgi:hypothetical protein
MFNEVCAKYGIYRQSHRNWRYKVYGIQPTKCHSQIEELRILEAGYQNGIGRVCAAYRITLPTYL